MDFNYFALSQENPPDPEPASPGSQDTYMEFGRTRVEVLAQVAKQIIFFSYFS